MTSRNRQANISDFAPGGRVKETAKTVEYQALPGCGECPGRSGPSVGVIPGAEPVVTDAGRIREITEASQCGPSAGSLADMQDIGS
jgi:hypothetical protein